MLQLLVSDKRLIFRFESLLTLRRLHEFFEFSERMLAALPFFLIELLKINLWRKQLSSRRPETRFFGHISFYNTYRRLSLLLIISDHVNELYLMKLSDLRLRLGNHFSNLNLVHVVILLAYLVIDTGVPGRSGLIIEVTFNLG